MSAQPSPVVIAIDGPSASGKSSVARRVAAELGYLYVDSGAVYRGLTWNALRRGVDVDDEQALGAMLRATALEFFAREGAVLFRVDGLEPGHALRGAEVSEKVSRVASSAAVRRAVVRRLRELTALGNLVMEGRDIGTAVFPDTPHKFYLDASPAERARRRHAELRQGGRDLSVESVGASLRRRDAVDRSRRMDPLRVAEGAVVVDSTGLGVEDVVRLIVRKTGARSEDTPR